MEPTLSESTPPAEVRRLGLYLDLELAIPLSDVGGGRNTRRPEVWLTPRQAQIAQRLFNGLAKTGRAEVRRLGDAIGWLLDQVGDEADALEGGGNENE